MDPGFRRDDESWKASVLMCFSHILLRLEEDLLDDDRDDETDDGQQLQMPSRPMRSQS